MKRSLLNVTLLLTLLLTAFTLSSYAQGKFVYTNNDRAGNNTISGFKLKADGKLELLPGFPTGVDGGGGDTDTRHSDDKIAVTEKGPYLFASSDGDQEVASFKIDPATGALTFIGTINLGDDGPDEVLALAVAPNEEFLYVANNNSHKVHALKINNDGTLTLLEEEQLSANFRALDIAVSPNSKFLALRIFQNEADPNGRLVMFTIANDGFLTEAPGSSFPGSSEGRTGDLVFNCESNLLFVAKEFIVEKGAIDVFHVAENGNLSQVQGSPFVFPGLTSASSIAISPNNKFLFVAYGSFNPARIGVFKIGSGGQLEVVVFSPFPTGYDGQLSDLAVDAKGERLFISYQNQRVESLTIDPDGRVTPVEDGVVTTGEDDDGDQSNLHSLVAFPLPKKCQIQPPDDLTVGSEAGFCGATVKYSTPSICGSDCGTVTCDPPSGSFFEVGTATVTCSSEGADDVTFKITVEDTQGPTIFQQPDIIVSTDPNKCSAKVNFTVSASDDCGTANAEADHAPNSEFPKGQTTVNIKATDEAGNESFYSFKITVNDTQAPQIICPADVMVNNEPGKCGAVANYAVPNASDNCPGVGQVSCNPPSGNFFPVGVTVVTCKVKDSSQNEGQCSFNVTVKDIQPPQIICPGDQIAATPTLCAAGIVINYPAPQVSDNCPNNLQVVCVPSSGSVFPVGTTNVTCTATDGGGNQSQCSFKVTVYNAWLQDDSNPSTVLLFNTFTGEYRLCYPGVNQPITGVGVVIKKGCSASLQHNAADRKLTAQVDAGVSKGTASYQSPPGSLKCTITDKNILNNTTICQ